MTKQCQFWVLFADSPCWELRGFYQKDTDWTEEIRQLKAGFRTPADYRIVEVCVIGEPSDEGF